MVESERGPLAERVATAMRDRNLTPHQIRANGGPRENTLYWIRMGTTRRPHVETLDDLALALATHPHSKRLDIDVMRHWRHEFYVAAGYDAQDEPRTTTMLEQVLIEMLDDVASARLWAAFIREHIALDIVTLVEAMGAFRAAVSAARARAAEV